MISTSTIGGLPPLEGPLAGDTLLEAETTEQSIKVTVQQLSDLIKAQVLAVIDARDNPVSIASNIPGYLAVVHDANGKFSDLRVRDTDGLFPDDVIERMAGRMAPFIGQRGLYSNIANMPAVHQGLGAIRAGDAVQLKIAAGFGDSYTAGDPYYLNKLATRMAKEYGFAGPGYIGFNHGGAFSNSNFRFNRDDTQYFGGSWVTSALGTASPDNRTITSGAVGDYVTIISAEGTDVPTEITSGKLLYLGDGNSFELRYRWADANPWETLTLTGTGVKEIAFPVMPVGKNWKFRMEVVTDPAVAKCVLYGVYLTSNRNGVEFSKLAASGSSSGDWSKPGDATFTAQRNASVALIPADAYICMLGGNDQGLGVPVAQYLANMIEIYNSIKAINPGADIILINRWDTTRTSAIPMKDYAAPLRKFCDDNKIAYADLSFLIGNDLNTYKSTGPRPLIGADNIHPIPATGGRVLTEFMHRMLTGSQ